MFSNIPFIKLFGLNNYLSLSQSVTIIIHTFYFPSDHEQKHYLFLSFHHKLFIN